MVTGAGELAQMVNGEAFRYLAYLELQPDPTAPRGNHYHAAKAEHLYIVDGLVVASYLDLDTGESVEVELTAGTWSRSNRAAPTRTSRWRIRTRSSSRRRAYEPEPTPSGTY